MIDYDKLWIEIDKVVEEEISRKKSYERTISEFSKLWGIGEGRTKLIVDKLEKSGQLLSRMVTSSNGKHVRVYYPVEYKTK